MKVVMKDKEKKEIVWKAAEYEYFRKNPKWYATVVLATAALFLLAIWQGNFFFAVFIFIAGAMVISLGKKKPRTLEFKINNKGVGIGKDDFFTYEELEGFSIKEHDHKLNEVIIKKETTLNPFIKLRIDSNMTEKAKEILEENLEEIEYEETATETFSDFFRF